jgi:plasmid stabilization system protein ParE
VESKASRVKAYSLSAAAENDLHEIWAYIAGDNISAADTLEAEILAACQRLATRPDLGHVRRDLTDESVLFFNVRGVYLIVYLEKTEPLKVVRILHGGRDLKGLF